MGMSKALMEKTAQAFARNHPDSPTTVCLVRYGNVMYTRGSVIPLFVRQLTSNGVVTVTDPSMTRFMMTLDQSVNLVEHAFVHGQPGDLFIRKSPAASIETLVTALSDLFGIRANMHSIGVRHGEKLHETLATSAELARSTEGPEYFRIDLDARGLDYGAYFDEGDLSASVKLDYDSASAEQLDVEALRDLLLNVPEIRSELALAGRRLPKGFDPPPIPGTS
jgi:UDP-glucose 4-epimerase